MVTEPQIDPRAVEALREIFGAAQDEIVRLLRNYQAANVPGPELGRQQVLLKQVEEILQQMRDGTMNWAEQWLPDAYNQGTLFATEALKDMGFSTGGAKGGFSVIDVNQIRALAEFAIGGVDGANASILDKIGFMIRPAGMLSEAADRQAALDLGIGMAKGESIQALKDRLLNSALQGGIGPGGYNGSLESYAELLARTRGAEAQNAGLVQRTMDYGVNLVKVTTHGGSCEVCAPLEGMVFCLDGTDRRFPIIETVGMAPWHPHCKHKLIPFVEELADQNEIDAALKRSQGMTLS